MASETEAGYIRRVASTVERALRQLPSADECWIALYWTNGAPIQAVLGALDWDQIPNHVLGLLFVGCALAFPHRNIDCYTVLAPRGSEQAVRQVTSSYDEKIARLVMERVEASAGVRPTLIRGLIQGKRRQVLLRDGSERILPFNLLMDRDDPDIGTRGRPRRDPH